MFIPISENLNAGWESVKKAIESRDSGYVQEAARAAVHGGAKAMNLSGTCGLDNELENLLWVMKTVAQTVDVAPALDSADPAVLSAAIENYSEFTGKKTPGGEPAPGEPPWLIVNSISAETERYEQVIPLVKAHRAGVIALAMDDTGVPEDAGKRTRVASELIERLRADGLPDSRIFIDVLVAPSGVNAQNGPAAADAVRNIREAFPDIHITCGLSNVSAGLPDRETLNRTFLPMLIAAGLDSAIMDTADPLMVETLHAALALAGKDPDCSGYLAEYRKTLKTGLKIK